MIRFTDLRLLKSIIDTLAIYTSKESHTAYNCVLIEQLDSRVTKFVTVEPKLGTYIRYLHHKHTDSSGIQDVKYMLEIKHLREELDNLLKAEIEAINIEEERGQLVILGDAQYINEELEFKQKKSLRLFTEHSKFITDKPCTEAEHLICQIPEENYELLIETMNVFGEFDNSKASISNDITGRATFRLYDSKLGIYGANRKSRNLMIKVEKNVTQVKPSEEYIFSIQGRQLSKITGIATKGTTINMYLKEDRLTIEGDLGLVVLAITKAPPSFEERLIPILNREHFITLGNRYVNVRALHTGILGQKLQSDYAETELLILELEEEGKLQITPLARVTNVDMAKVLIDPAMYGEGDWELLMYTFTPLDKAFDTLTKVLRSIARRQTNQVTYLMNFIQEAVAKDINGKVHLTYFVRFILEQAQDIEIVYVPRSPEYVRQKLAEGAENCY